jgi:hypothetical protein
MRFGIYLEDGDIVFRQPTIRQRLFGNDFSAKDFSATVLFGNRLFGNRLFGNDFSAKAGFLISHKKQTVSHSETIDCAIVGLNMILIACILQNHAVLDRFSDPL